MPAVSFPLRPERWVPRGAALRKRTSWGSVLSLRVRRVVASLWSLVTFPASRAPESSIVTSHASCFSFSSTRTSYLFFREGSTHLTEDPATRSEEHTSELQSHSNI